MDQADKPAKRPRRGGRAKGTPNKTTREVRALAQEYGPSAIKVLAELMLDDEQLGATRRAAAVDLLDRGYGKPASVLQVDDGEGGTALPSFIGLVGMTAEDVRQERERRALTANSDADAAEDAT